jgi:hypothetical protein
MLKPADLRKHVDPNVFIREIQNAVTTKRVEALLSQLPIVGENQYVYDTNDPYKGWQEGKYHWVPVGLDRGNGGRIKLAGDGVNPLGERAINGMEALIEMMRQLELTKGPCAAPTSPREAVMRYFDLPPLEEVPRLDPVKNAIKGYKPREYARKLATMLRIRLMHEGRPAEYTVLLEDEGIGQPPEKMHSTLLSLGSSDKSDKPYLIGVFGQGGSSTYAASGYSWLMSRRHPELLTNGFSDGVGWSVVKHIYPKNTRADYFAYLAAHPDGLVPMLPASAAEMIGFKHGTRFAHVAYDFGKTEPARRLYPALNHLLFNPVLPYELYTGPGRPADPMYGNGYRLSLKAEREKPEMLDKTTGPHTIMKG